MAVDLSIERLAFILYSKLWIKNGLPDDVTCANYPEHVIKETEYSDEILDAVYATQVLSRSFYERVTEKDFEQFSASRSDFHSYFISHCLKFIEPTYPCVVRILASAAFIAEMGLACARKSNFVFVRNCPLSWAMYFDWELKSRFYRDGGWAYFQRCCEQFRNTYSFVMSFGSPSNICQQITNYLRFFSPMLLETLDVKSSQKWYDNLIYLQKCCDTTSDNSVPEFSFINFKGTIFFPWILNIVCNSSDFKLLSYISNKKDTYYNNQIPNLRLDDDLENISVSKTSDSKTVLQDNKSNPSNRKESKFINHYFPKPVDESASEMPDPANNAFFQSSLKVPTIDVSGNNSTSQDQTEDGSGNSGNSEVFEQDGSLLKQSIEIDYVPRLRSNKCDPNSFKQDGMEQKKDQEDRAHTQTKELNPPHHTSGSINEQACEDLYPKNDLEVRDVSKTLAENRDLTTSIKHSEHSQLSGARIKENVQEKSFETKTNVPSQKNRALRKQFELPCEHNDSEILIGLQNQQKSVQSEVRKQPFVLNNRIPDLENISKRDQISPIKTSLINESVVDSNSINTLEKDTSKEFAGAKISNDSPKKRTRKRKKKKPSQKPEILVQNPNNKSDTPAFEQSEASQSSCDDQETVLRMLLVLGTPSTPGAFRD